MENINDKEEKCNIPTDRNKLILTPKDAEIFFNEMISPKEAKEDLKRAMLNFIAR